MDGNCIFCDIVANRAEAARIDSNDLCVAFLDASPINPGHTLVVPRQHLVDIHSLEGAVCASLFDLARRVSSLLRDSTVPCEGINLLMSNGAVAGQSVFHAHLHVVPRNRNDGFSMSELHPPPPPGRGVGARGGLWRRERGPGRNDS
ncbi:MAG: HIT domain-containing protein [Micrococcaceae bacterium]|nr:HIT domain-containing protein [Micrococcaceae bacterium]